MMPTRFEPAPGGARKWPHFVFVSFLLHGALLLALFKLGSFTVGEAVRQRTEARFAASLGAVHRHEARRRLGHLRDMKALMERITQAQADAAAPEPGSDAPPRPGEPSGGPPESEVQTPAQMLAQATQLAESIRQLDTQTRAEALQRLLSLSPEAALRQAAEAAPPPLPLPDAQTATEEQVAQALVNLTREAQEALKRQARSLDQRQHGTAIDTEVREALHTQVAQATDTSQGNATQLSGREGAGAKAGASKAGGGALGGAAQQGAAAGGGQPQQPDRPGLNSAGGLEREMQEQSSAVLTHSGVAAPIEVDRSHMVKAWGRVVGDDAPYANRVYLHNWYVIGPFHAAQPSAIHTVFPPERLVDLDGVYAGKGGRPVRWTYVDKKAYPLVPPNPRADAIYYGYTEIMMDRARDVWVAFGSDDDAKVWVNGALVWMGGPERKAWYTTGGYQGLTALNQDWNLNEGRRRLHFRQGRNKLMFKLYNGPQNIFMSVVLEGG